MYARMLEGSRSTVVGQNSDKSYWFRFTHSAPRDCARGMVTQGGKDIKDLRVAMGTSNGAKYFARVISLSVSYLERQFDAEIESFLKKLPADLVSLFMACYEGIMQIYGP